MRRADHIIDLGPHAGAQGGEIVATGLLREIIANPNSLTGKYLKHPMRHPSRGSRRSLKGAPGWIELIGAHLHNLKDLDIRVPVNRLTVVTGISGSGKSTLVRGVLLPAVKETLNRKSSAADRPKDPRYPGNAPYRAIRGVEPLGAVSKSINLRSARHRARLPRPTSKCSMKFAPCTRTPPLPACAGTPGAASRLTTRAGGARPARDKESSNSK